MPIKATCQCGASFAAKDELAGKRVRCPKCKEPLTIPGGQGGGGGAIAKAAPRQVAPAQPAAAPAPSAMDDLFDEVGLEAARGPRCPQCNAPLKPNAVLCVECGFNLQSGDKVEGAQIASGPGGHEGTANAMLDFAAKELADDAAEMKKSTSSGAPFYVYLFFIIVLLAFGVMMLTMPRPRAFWITGNFIMGFAALQILYYRIRFHIAAFFESTGQGFLSLIPGYDLFYLITRWSDVGIWFIKSLSSCGIVLLGWIFVVIAPFFKENREVQVPTLSPPAIVVHVDADLMTWRS